MIAKLNRYFIAGAIVALTSAAALAQEVVKDEILLSGNYEITQLNADSVSVSMTFSATISNTGPKDVSGKIVLNNPSVIQKFYNEFGSQSIPAGGNVSISDTVTVPREEYNAWLSRGPNLTFYAQNDRGELKTFRIPLVGKTPAPKE